MTWSRPWVSETKLVRALSVHFTGRPSVARGMQHADIFGKDDRLHAERAADIAGQDAQPVDRRRSAPRPAWRAGRTRPGSRHGRCSGRVRVVVADRRARLHRVDDDAVVDDAQPRDMGGAARRPPRRPRRRRSGSRATTLPGASSKSCGAPGAIASLAGRSRRSQRLDVERHGLGGVLRLRPRSSATTKATMSPTKRTLSVASAGRAGLIIGEPSRLLQWQRARQRAVAGGGEIGRRYRRRARPAWRAPPRASTPRSTPWAWGLRTKAA